MEAGTGLPDLDAITRNDAVRLFMDRATAGLRAFEVSSSNAPAVAALADGLDGIPLAIELAAASVPMMAPVDILARLDQRFRLLTGGCRGSPPRQQRSSLSKPTANNGSQRDWPTFWGPVTASAEWKTSSPVIASVRGAAHLASCGQGC